MAGNNTLWISGIGGLWNDMLCLGSLPGRLTNYAAVVVRWDRDLS